MAKKARQPYFKIFSWVLQLASIFLEVFHWIGGWIFSRMKSCWALVACRFLRCQCRGRSWILRSGATVCGADQAVHRAVGGEEIVSDISVIPVISWPSNFLESSKFLRNLEGSEFLNLSFRSRTKMRATTLISDTISNWQENLYIPSWRLDSMHLMTSRRKYNETGFFYKTWDFCLY